MHENRCIGILVLFSFICIASAEFVSLKRSHPNDYQMIMTNTNPDGAVELRCAAMQKRRAIAFYTFVLINEVNYMYSIHSFDRPFRIRCNYYHANTTVYGVMLFDSKAPYADKCRKKNGGCSYDFSNHKMVFGYKGGHIRVTDLSGKIPKPTIAGAIWREGEAESPIASERDDKRLVQTIKPPSWCQIYFCQEMRIFCNIC